MAEDSEAAEVARAQAEARRKRILEKAQKRMGKVSGEVGQDDDDKEQSESNAARIRAARQRRYGKKSKPAEENSTTADAVNEGGERDVENEPGENEDPEPAYVVDEKEALGEKPTVEPSPAVEALEQTLSGSVDEVSVTSEPKKKYLGVARMRRKMILKKKNENEDESSKVMPKKESFGVGIQEKTLPQSSRNSIYMHIVTVLLLFIAGFDVGLNQFHHDVVVHHQLAFTEVGVPLLRDSPTKANENKFHVDTGDIQDVDEDLANEFAAGTDEGAPIANIDPLFKVDLDELTKGPGVLMFLARAAVAVHRLILRIFYFTPKSIMVSLLSLPEALMKNPPTLCLLALILRQIVGNRILYAGIPGPEVEEKESGVDVVAMVKQAVTNWLSGAFPNAVGIYEAFSHLRSDMYIIICGVFFGLAWSHRAIEFNSLTSDPATATDEL